MIKVTVAEVQRDVIKQLGIDLSGSFSTGTAVVNFNQANPFSAFGQSLSGSNVTSRIGELTGNNVTATLKAMERAGVVRTLAEPNLTVISGETGLFVAGGEFPIPNGLSCDTTRSPPVCQQQIDFKKFGVSLSFTPVVLGEGRISLKVGTEVSDLSSENAITLSPIQGQSLTIPSIRARRADTVVEIPSGGSLAMAGMIQEQTKQQINGFPGLQQLPILGVLFKSRDYINKQTELMILATPYVVRAVAQKDLSRPDDGFADAPDSSTVFLNRLNKIYGIPDKVDPKQVWRGNVGFIID
jgi:pilus assembly protein CpaC